MSKLNPGIQHLVHYLNEQGFSTCDSGDGQTHDFECDRPYAYVVIMIEDKAKLIEEADRLYDLILGMGREVRSQGEHDPEGYAVIQANYVPGEGCFIDLSGIADRHLPLRYYSSQLLGITT